MRWLAPALLLLAAGGCDCSGGGTVAVEIQAGAGFAGASLTPGEVDGVALAVFGESDRSPLMVSSRQGFSGGLPHTVVLRAGPGTAGRRIRAHAVVYKRDLRVAEGDAVVGVPATGRATEVLVVEPACLGVICPRLQSCVAAADAGSDAGADAGPDAGADVAPTGCDGRCFTNDGCLHLGCDDSMAVCNGATSTCTGRGADSDGDTHLDRLCVISDRTADDCDDTSDAARPDGGTACGARRDHDCNGIVDELEYCATCSPARPSPSTAMGMGRELQTLASAGAVLAVTGRIEEPAPFAVEPFVVVGTQSSVTSISLATQTEIDSVGAPAVHQLFLDGSVLAAATDEGLLLLWVDRSGHLAPAGPPVAVPAERPGPLRSVLVLDRTAWVSGDNVGLAAVDILDLEQPLVRKPVVTSSPDAPAAVSLARTGAGAGSAYGILAASDDRSPLGGLYFYLVSTALVPMASPTRVPLSCPEARAFAVVLRPDVTMMIEKAVVAVTCTSDDRIVVVQRSFNDWSVTSELPGVASPRWLYVDQGLAMFATSTGGLVAFDDAGSGHTYFLGGAPPTAFWATTLPGGEVRAVLGYGDRIRIVEIPCI